MDHDELRTAGFCAGLPAESNHGIPVVHPSTSSNKIFAFQTQQFTRAHARTNL